jgi:hypothetical protein
MARSREALLRGRRVHRSGRQPGVGVLPGPQTLTFFLGVAMIAGEFRPVARLLDGAEVRLREFGRWVGGVWSSSAAGKASVVSVAAICVAAVLWGLICYSSPADFEPRLIHASAWKEYLEGGFSELRLKGIAGNSYSPGPTPMYLSDSVPHTTWRIILSSSPT